jgi:tRNA pseudouridine32 synthase/23S rRNA pseudouridine746 synthase
MRIVFQNSHFVAVEKPAGFLSVPARAADDPRPVLGRLLEKELNRAIFPVHRLDAEVSGLVLYALHPDAHRSANDQFGNRQVEKTYQAFSKGGAFQTGDRGEWKAKILRGKKRAYESPAGKLAVTRYEVVRLFENGVLEWRLFPKTGRSHQLRWELFRHETPILGDRLYGSNESWTEGVALRSLSLDFTEEFAARFELPIHLSVGAWVLDSKNPQKPATMGK